MEYKQGWDDWNEDINELTNHKNRFSFQSFRVKTFIWKKEFTNQSLIFKV